LEIPNGHAQNQYAPDHGPEQEDHKAMQYKSLATSLMECLTFINRGTYIVEKQ